MSKYNFYKGVSRFKTKFLLFVTMSKNNFVINRSVYAGTIKSFTYKKFIAMHIIIILIHFRPNGPHHPIILPPFSLFNEKRVSEYLLRKFSRLVSFHFSSAGQIFDPILFSVYCLICKCYINSTVT